MYDDKCKYIDCRNLTNFQIHFLFLTAGLLEDKAREKGIVNVYIFQQPIALSKTGLFIFLEKPILLLEKHAKEIIC